MVNGVAEDDTTNTAETVNTNLDNHLVLRQGRRKIRIGGMNRRILLLMGGNEEALGQ